MPEVSPGHYACTLHLLPGIYRYKFRVDGREWVLDPHAPVVDWLEGAANGLCFVDGIAKPVWFAPDRRHVVQTLDGRFRLHAEVRGHNPLPTYVQLHTGKGTVHHIPLQLQRHGADHTFLHADHVLPAPAKSLTFDGIHRVPLPPVRPALGAPPAWLHHAVFYAIFVDRWRRGAASPPDPRASPRTTLSTPDTFYGGDLDGITESLDGIRALGVDAVVLTPIHPSQSPHRYDGVDLLATDARLGGDAALERLLDRAHALGLKVVLDAAITHVHAEHPAFQDVLARQEKSPFAAWFQLKRFPVLRGDGSTYAHYYNNAQLPWLNLRPGPAREHVITAMERLVRMGADGLRLDAMNDAPDDFWAELRARVRALRDDVLLLGEVVSDNPARLAQECGVDTATDFGHKDACVTFFARSQTRAEDFRALLERLEHRMGPADPCFRLLFLDNHDTPRFMTLAANHDRVRVALAWLLLRPEPVWLTYGVELGMFGGRLVGDLDDAWPERLPMPPDSQPTQTSALLQHLTALRRHEPALRSDVLRYVHAQDRLLVVDRGSAPHLLRIIINAGEHAVDILPFLPPGSTPVTQVHGAAVAGRTPPWSVQVLRLPG